MLTRAYDDKYWPADLLPVRDQLPRVKAVVVFGGEVPDGCLELDALLAESDVVTLHASLTPASTGLLDDRRLRLMKPTAFIVNTSRGPIVGEAAFIDTMKRRAIRRAALDVFNIEPLPKGHPLATLDNVVLSPHLGYASEDNMRQYFIDAVENLEAWLGGNPIRVMGAH